MFKLFRKMKAQSTVEYAVLIIVIIGALLAIQTYIKRGVQGRLKSSTDDIGDQFSPGNTNAVKTVITSSNTQELFGMDNDGTAQQGLSVTNMLAPEQTNTQDRQQIINVDQEFWGHT